MSKLITVLFLFLSSQLISQLPSNLRAYYSFDGNTNDSMGINTPGVNNGGLFTTNRFGLGNKAISFNRGNPDYVNLGNDLSFSSTTISAWINPINGPQEQYYLSNLYNQTQYGNTGIELRLHLNGKINVLVGNVTNSPASWRIFEANSAIPYGQWSHITVVIDNFTSVKIFINGILDFQSSISGITYSKSLLRMLVGTRANPVTEYPYSGKVDELMIFNKALTDAEARLVYSLTNGIDKQTLLSPFKFINPVINHTLVLNTMEPDISGKIQFYSMNCVLVKEFELNSAGKYDIGDLENGIYTLAIHTSKGVETKKLILTE